MVSEDKINAFTSLWDALNTKHRITLFVCSLLIIGGAFYGGVLFREEMHAQALTSLNADHAEEVRQLKRVTVAKPIVKPRRVENLRCVSQRVNDKYVLSELNDGSVLTTRISNRDKSLYFFDVVNDSDSSARLDSCTFTPTRFDDTYYSMQSDIPLLSTRDKPSPDITIDISGPEITGVGYCDADVAFGPNEKKQILVRFINSEAAPERIIKCEGSISFLFEDGERACGPDMRVVIHPDSDQVVFGATKQEVEQSSQLQVADIATFERETPDNTTGVKLEESFEKNVLKKLNTPDAN